MVLCLRCQLVLVNKPNISIGLKILVWNFTNIEYWNVGISISTLISVQSGTVLLFWRFYYSDHRCSNWPNKKRNSVERICWKYQFPIQNIISVPKFEHLPANCDSSLTKAHYYKTWRDKSCFERSCFRVLPDLLTKKGLTMGWYTEHSIRGQLGDCRKKSKGLETSIYNETPT